MLVHLEYHVQMSIRSNCSLVHLKCFESSNDCNIYVSPGYWKLQIRIMIVSFNFLMYLGYWLP